MKGYRASSFCTVGTPRHKRLWEMNLLHLADIRDRRDSAHGRSERGAGKFKAVLVIAVIALVIYSAVKIIPAYFSDYQLSDKMQEQARFAVVNRYTEEQIRENIFKVVQDLEIPAKREDIKVLASPSIVRISLDYTVPVDLVVYRIELHFSPASANKSLF